MEAKNKFKYWTIKNLYFIYGTNEKLTTIPTKQQTQIKNKVVGDDDASGASSDPFKPKGAEDLK